MGGDEQPGRDEDLYVRLRRLPVPTRLIWGLEGRPVLQESAINATRGRTFAMARRLAEGVLTAAQLRVLAFASRGLTTEQIAEAGGWSSESVKDSLKLARRALRAKNTTHAVAEALRRGLIP